METSHYWINQNIDHFSPLRSKNQEIYSYRIYSHPLRKKQNLKIKATKKILSPIPSKDVPNLIYKYTPMNKTFLYQKPKKLDSLILETNDNRITMNNSKAKWAEKHCICFQKCSPRSRSIQNEYAKEILNPRRSLISTCEISLQTFNLF